eukprot:GGOE01012016.1.p5 GENE.GGOE01012016.1~~GGOE01012016.1.p5  ORF type:complete len:113 (-),score=3.96 GGOE01012016.1:1266-1604(-)
MACMSPIPVALPPHSLPFHSLPPFPIARSHPPPGNFDINILGQAQCWFCFPGNPGIALPMASTLCLVPPPLSTAAAVLFLCAPGERPLQVSPLRPLACYVGTAATPLFQKPV